MTARAPASWSNWSGIESCTPERVVRPTDTAQVQDAVRSAARDGLTVRAVGSSHSFTGAAVAHGVQLQFDGMARLLDVDAETGLVRVEAGMPLHRLNPLLAQHGLAMPNLGDVDLQTVAGAISTGTHGTGAALPGLAAQVADATLVAGDGSVVTCSASDRPGLLDAVRVSLGALGVLTEVVLQTVPAFALRAVESPAPLDDVVERLDDLVACHDHFELYWYPHTDRVQMKCNDRVAADEPLRPIPTWRRVLDDELLSNVLFEGLNRFAARVPSVVPRLNGVSARALTAREYVDTSYKVFVTPRRVRFNESEYAVPRESVRHVLGELKQWVDRSDERIPFPVEVRFAAPDDGWLSTAYQRANGYVAVHQYHRMQHRPYFAAFEAIVAEVQGRPHWGKLHSLHAEELAGLYPRFADFTALRDELDPGRVFANPYTERVFGG